MIRIYRMNDQYTNSISRQVKYCIDVQSSESIIKRTTKQKQTKRSFISSNSMLMQFVVQHFENI